MQTVNENNLQLSEFKKVIKEIQLINSWDKIDPDKLDYEASTQIKSKDN